MQTVAVVHNGASERQVRRRSGHWPRCGAEMRIIAFITEAPSVHEILTHLGELTSPPRIAPARGPPLWEMADAGQASSTLKPSRHRIGRGLSEIVGHSQVEATTFEVMLEQA